MKLEDLIKQARKKKNWSLRELSKKSGVSFSYLSSLERGEYTNPSAIVLKKLANATGIDEKELFDALSTTLNEFEEKKILSKITNDQVNSIIVETFQR